MDNFSSKIEEYVVSRVIFGPVTRDLKSCLANTNREILRDYGRQYYLDKVEEKGSIRLSEELERKILGNLERLLSYKEEGFIEKFYQEAQEGKLELEEGFEGILNFMEYNHFGWGFLFVEEGEEDFVPVIPEEIKASLKEISKEELLKTSRLYQDLDLVLRALTHLYGVYEEDQFLTVWESLGKEEVSQLDLHRVLVGHPDNGTAFRLFDKLIIHGTFESPKEAEELKSRASKKKYYLPTLEEVEIYADHYANPNSPEYKEVKAYLEKNSSSVQADRGMLQLEFFSASSPKKDMETILNILASSGILIEKGDFQEFGDLMTDFLNRSPIWENRGRTPQSLYDETVKDMKNMGEGNILHKDLLQ